MRVRQMSKVSNADIVAASQLELILWTIENIIRLKSKQVFGFDRYPFLADIYRDKSLDIAIEKSAQMGLTTFTACDSIWRASQGATVAYYFPQLEMLRSYVNARFNNLVALNPKLALLIGKSDSVYLKTIGSGSIHFKLLSTTAEDENFGAKSLDADALVFDEYNLMLEEKANEAMSRIMGSSEPAPSKYISTPTFPDIGINRKFKQGDQRYWLLKCPHCNHYNCVEDNIENKQFPRIILQGFLSCVKCDKELDLLAGEWVPKHPENKRLRSYHICRLYDVFASKLGLVDRMLNEFQTTRFLGKFYNDNLGLPYADSALRLTVEDILRLCAKDEPIYATSQTPCSMGVDIGDKKGINYVVSRPSTRGKMRDVVGLGVVFDINELDKIIIDYNVRKFVIDGKYEKTAVQDFVKKWGRLDGWRCDYVPIKSDYIWDKSDRLIKVNRTDSLDRSQYLLRNGHISLPDAANSEVKVFATHCSNIAKNTDVDERTGNASINYIKLGPEDYRHAFNYDCLSWYEGEQGKNNSAKSHLFTANSFYTPSALNKGNIQSAKIRSNVVIGRHFK